MNITELLNQAKVGFETIKVGDQFKQSALKNIELWLTNPLYADYVPQLEHIITSGYFDYLLDCFYQVIPFGTGGRRGEVGIGPNRINPFTIMASAQGHSQYLIKQYGDSAKTRGVVLTYDVRKFYSNRYFNDSLPNPVRNLDCKNLAVSAATVYAANQIKVFLFDDVRSTPELSFAIRYLKCVSGDMFSASHNPPEHNGKKVYDEYGGQLIPPDDEKLVTEVVNNVTDIKTIAYDDAIKSNLIIIVGHEIDQAYWDASCRQSLSKNRQAKIVYSPLHGCGLTSVAKVLAQLHFEVHLDPKTSNLSGKFENVTFNIPNPEVIQSFDTSLAYAKTIDADLIINSDPDADRVGFMVKHHNDWQFINGNEIGSILARYVIDKKLSGMTGTGIMVKTQVTTNLISRICEHNNVDIIGDLLVGYKYVGDIMNQLEKDGRINNCLLSMEESHGYLGGDHIREKDAVIPAIWMSELAGELKMENKTIIDYLHETYSKYGYFRNYLTEVRLPGAEGMSQIQQIQTGLRQGKFSQIGDFKISSREDWLDRLPIVSETDRVAKNGLVFNFVPKNGTVSIKVTVRPSGTEPKIKMYYEIGSQPFDPDSFTQISSSIEQIRLDLEKSFMMHCYKLIGIDFPERGFLLFWQLPLQDKLKYFEVEPKIEALKSIANSVEKRQQLFSLISFLGSDPLKKINAAFKAKYHQDVEEYLSLP